MDSPKPLENSLKALMHYIEQEGYKGYDPYDALSSPLFRLPLLRSAKLPRYAMQQVVKRMPFSLRKLLFIPKGLNPVTIGLCIQAYTYLTIYDAEEKTALLKKIEDLLQKLTELQSKGYSGACWGYEFDWEARYANIPAFTPTVVATGIIANALYHCYKITGNERAKALCISSADFVLKDLNRTEEGEGYCFSYSPGDHQKVFNASMKGVKVLAQVYELTGDQKYLDEARPAVDFAMKYQNEDGSWGYSRNKAGLYRVDNYHTGYMLDALDDYINFSGDKSYQPALTKAFAYYRAHFFEDSGMPRFYNIKAYPADCTSASQAILSLVRFDEPELASKVATWMSDHMQSNKGYFYFRKFKGYTIRTSMMRWSNAWMFLALAQLMAGKVK